MRQPIFDRLESAGKLDSVKKYAHSELEGKFALLTDTELKEFQEFEDTPKKLAVILEFAPNNIKEVEDRVIQPLISLEESLGLNFSLAVRDVPFHCTILTGKTENEDDLLEAEKTLTDSGAFNEMCQNILNTELEYGLLVYERTGAFLAATKIPDSIKTMREFLKNEYSAQGLRPVKLLDNFLHCAISRMTKLPTINNRKEIFDQYLKALQPIRIALTRDPIRFNPQDVYMGKLADFLKNDRG